MAVTVQLLTNTFHLRENPAITLQVGQRDTGGLVLVFIEHNEGGSLVMTAATLTDIDRVASRLLGGDLVALPAGASCNVPDEDAPGLPAALAPSPPECTREAAGPVSRLPQFTDAHVALLTRMAQMSPDGRYVSDQELYEADPWDERAATRRESWRGYRLLGELEDAGLVVADHHVVVAPDGSAVSDVLCFALTEAGRSAVTRSAERSTRDDGGPSQMHRGSQPAVT